MGDNDIIREYSEQGDHRTVSQVDGSSGNWLVNRIRDIGFEPVKEEFPFMKLVVHDAFLEIEGEKYQGLPLFDCISTERRGVKGSFGPVNSSSDIGVMAATTENMEVLWSARRQNRHKAIAVITDPEVPGLSPLNAEHYLNPFGPPVLLIASELHGDFMGESKRGLEARLVAHFSYTSGKAHNVTTTVQGVQNDLAPLVVMTPRSGWWTCASERGGGILTFLKIMREFKTHRSKRGVIFTANSGHELGHLGLGNFITNRETMVKDAHAWIHLGANYAAKGSWIYIQTSDHCLNEIVFSAMNKYGCPPDSIRPLGQRPFGEARNIFDGGGRYVSIVARENPLFHSPQDIWPDAVSMGRAEAISEAFIEISKQLANN